MIVKLEDCEEFGINPKNVHAQAFTYKKEFGTHPDWYIKDVKARSIDLDKYFSRSDLERRVWNYATDKLFYLLVYDFKITENRLAQIMANKSFKFDNQRSWVSFLAQGLFSPHNEKKHNMRYSMTADFLRVGSRLAYQLIKDARINQDGNYSEDLKYILNN